MSKLLAVGFLLAAFAFGQTDRGTITGTVTDPAGAVVANAPIELKGTETGAIFPATTSATGNYTFTQIPVGQYELSVTVPGFKKYVRQNIRVQAAQTLGLDIGLEVGAASESVTVSAEVSLLRTESSDVSTNVDASRLTSLPVLPIGNGFSSSHGVRNPMAVSSLAPGTYFDPNLNIKVNGAPSNTAAIHVDGQDATNGVVTFSQAQTQPSVEALQELSIQTSNFAAEYGQAGAGLFNYTSKSGTNRFSGNLYDYFSNEALNASQAYTGSRPQTRRNNFGGTFGGPVWIPGVYNGKDKTWFFVNYEAFKERLIVTNQFPTVPTDAYRAGNFATAMLTGRITGNPADSQNRVAIDGQIFDPLSEARDANGRRYRVPFANNTIPAARLDPSAVKLLSLIPRANLAGLTQNYNSPYLSDRYTSIPGVKIDQAFGASGKLSAYYSRTGTAVQYCTPLCGSDGLPDPITATRGTFIESNTIRLNYDHTLSPTLLFHIGAGFLRNDFKDRAPTTDFDMLATLGIKGATAGPKDGARFPVFDNGATPATAITGVNSTGGISLMGPAAGQVRGIENKPTGNISLTWVKDNHTYKFGGDVRFEGFIDVTFSNTTGRYSIPAVQSGNPYFSDAGVALTGGETGFGFASLMLGRVQTVQISPLTSFRGGRNFFAGFAQDTWKVTRALTVDYGLRWDYSTYSREQYGRAPAFSALVANPTANGRLGGSIYEGTGPGLCNCDFAKNYPYAFGPRLGLAYQITPKTVLRAGFGVTYSAYTGGRYTGAPGANQTLTSPAVGAPVMVLSEGISNQGQPVNTTWPQFNPGIFPAPGTTSGTPLVFDQNRGRPGRQAQWSIGLQRELTRDLVVEGSYVANRGAWWASGVLTDYNALNLDTLRANGLDITSAADRTILSSQIGQAGAGRFQNRLPYASFPRSASVAQSLRPYPQFGNLTGANAAGPLGKTWYDSFQGKVTKRVTHGLEMTYNFTWSKELQLGADTDGGGLAGQVNDLFNRDTNKQFSSFSRPFWNVFAVNYQLPRWSNSKVMNWVAADWTVAFVAQYGSGVPIPVPATALATSNLATSLLRGTRAERIPGVDLFKQDLNCHCFDPAQSVVLNPAAWKDPTPGTFSPSAYYYNDYRYQRRPRETFSFGRIFGITERVKLALRAEFTNPFNRTQVPNPIATGYTAAVATSVAPGGQRVNNTGFGVIATRPANAVIGERSGLLVGRLSF